MTVAARALVGSRADAETQGTWTLIKPKVAACELAAPAPLAGGKLLEAGGTDGIAALSGVGLNN